MNLEEAELNVQIDDLESELDRQKRENKKLKNQIEKTKVQRKRMNIAMASFITIVSIAAGSMAHSLYDNFKMIRAGKDSITSNVYERCMKDTAWHNYYDGIKFNIGEEYFEYREFLSTVKARAEVCDISDIDLYIAVSDVFNKSVAEDMVGEIKSEDINNRAYEVYLNNELESVRTNGR